LVNVILFSTIFHYGDWFWFSPYFYDIHCFRIKGFWVLQLSIINRQERESEQIMNLLLSETNFKARSIAQYIFGTCMLNV
jgi:hypothetical protein